jgi:hypothetical protein
MFASAPGKVTEVCLLQNDNISNLVEEIAGIKRICMPTRNPIVSEDNSRLPLIQ